MDSKILNNIYKEINNLNLFFKNYIKKYLIKNSDFCYSKKSDLIDGLLFHLLKTQINSTQSSVSTFLSLNNKNKISRQGLVKRSDKININNLNKIYDDLIKKFNKSDDVNFHLIDGTKINIYHNKTYKTINLLGILSNNINSNIYNNENLNASELSLFYDYLDKNIFDNNQILILDRLYFSDKFVNKCFDKNINFICRLKSNSMLLKKYNKLENNDRNDYVELNKGNLNRKIRIITFKNNNKIFHLASNLLDAKLDIDYFKKAYKSRWNIEINFKLLKANLNLDNLKTKKQDKINKELKSIDIVNFIFNYILKIYNKETKNNKKINKELFIKNFYEHLLYKLIKGKLTKKSLSLLLEIIIVFYYESKKKKTQYPRKAIMPYKKWHKKARYRKLK